MVEEGKLHGFLMPGKVRGVFSPDDVHHEQVQEQDKIVKPVFVLASWEQGVDTFDLE